jgi:DNA modification methylase
MQLFNDDCLKVLPTIPDNSIDLILTDPPYGTTACKWDSVIPFEPMWKELKRITKENSAIALFGTEPFSSHLRLSNLDWFKYDWVWQKNKPTGNFLAKMQPMKWSLEHN